jgi:sugar phosphate isomerase/epimerase
VKFAVCNEIFRGLKLEDAFACAAKVGYDGVEIAPFTISHDVTDIAGAERRKIREIASRNGITIPGIHWVLAQTEGMHVTHAEHSIRARTARYLTGLVDFCADIGGEVLIFGSPKQRNLMEGVSLEQGREWAAETFCPAVKRAEDRGVTICLEPLSPAETNFINTAAEAIDFTRPFNSPRFQIILDVKAMCSEGKPIAQIIHDSWPRFAHFHANDANLQGPGFGDVDFTPIARALKEVGYGGYVSVEVFKFEEGPEVIATKSLEYLRRVFVGV